ncbi:MAG: ScyD/ScyE family protein [Pseudonocardiaceae bacterium]
MAASVARRRARRFAAAGVVALAVAVAPGAQAAAQPSFTVIASGLDNPRGLAFGPDGALYVAEAGRGGSGPCIPGPEGDEVCFGLTGAVTRIKGSQQSRSVTGLPSLAEQDGSAASGPSDVSFLGLGFVTIGLGADPAARAQLPPSGRTLGHLLTFAPGAPRALPLPGAAGSEVSATLAQLLPPGRSLDHFLRVFAPRVPRALPAVPIADVAGHEASANPDGGEVDSNPQAVQVGPRGAAVTDAGGNSLVQVGFDRRIETLAVFGSRMVDAPPFLGLPPGAQIPMQSVPTGVVSRGGAHFVSELTGFPFQVGAARVHRVVPGQPPQVFATGLTNAIDLDFGPGGTLYVLEIAHNSLLADPPRGALVKVRPGQAPEVVLDGLNFPTGLTIQGGSAYLTDCGVCAGGGRVLRVPL